MKKKSIFLIWFVGCLVWASPGSGRSEELELTIPETAVLGQPFRVRVQSGKPFQRLKLTWLRKELEIPVKSSAGEYVAMTLLGTDVKFSKPGEEIVTAEVQTDSGTILLKKAIRITGKDYPEQHLTVPEKMVHLSESALRRVRREQRIAGRLLRTVTRNQWLKLPLARPAEGDISSPYGLKRFFNKQPRSPHRGIDIKGLEGDPIFACSGGRVLLVDNHYFAGKSVYLDHGCGIISVYFHLSNTDIKEGQWIDRGEKIGSMGKTGRVTGPHLHFGLYILAMAVDPLPLFGD